MPKPTDARVPPLLQLRKSPRETQEEFERRNRQFNDFKDFKMKNFPRVNLVFTEEPLLLTNIVKYPQRSCNQQHRQLQPQIIFTHRSLRPSVTSTATATDSAVRDTYTDSSESILGKSTTGIDTSTNTVPSGLTVATTETSTSTVTSELTATTTDTSTSPVRSLELNDNELMKKLQERNPKIDLSVYLIPQKTHLDFSQYLIQKPHHHQADSEKMVAGILHDLLDNLDCGEDNGDQECENTSSKTGIRVTKFQRFRRNVRSLKTRIVRAMTPLTSCFSLKSMHTTD